MFFFPEAEEDTAVGSTNGEEEESTTGVEEGSTEASAVWSETSHFFFEEEEEEEEEDDDFKRLVKKHFKKEPTKTPYANKFMSLWWVDYFMASHNIWHICVLLGILGHYSCLVHMFNEIKGILK